MLSYSSIVRRAFYATTTHPALWAFGLFVVGAFNLNFLYFQNIPLRQLVLSGNFLALGLFFQQHPGFLALVSFSVFVLSVLGLLLTNWSRIMLILLGGSIIKTKDIQLREQLKKSGQPLFEVIRISLLTASLMLVVAVALLWPPVFLGLDPSLKILLLEIGGLIFLPLVFVISCVNIFTTFYAVVYKKSLIPALDLGTDFFVSRWTQILGLVALLVVIYLGSFIVGVSLIFLIKLALRFVFLALLNFNILSLSAIMIGLQVFSTLLLWLLLSGLSVFFNQALLILFFELNTPVDSESLAKERKVSPAPSA